MMSLAHFYGWSLNDIRRMNMFELEEATRFMVEEKKRRAKQNGN